MSSINVGYGGMVFSHSLGWGCSKEAELDFDIMMMPDRTAKKSIVITYRNAFEAVEDCQRGASVNGIFKYENGTKIAFNGVMEGKGRITVSAEINNDFETILKNIKKWQFTKENY